ncbi:MAG: Rpn family recombination-promoting nuclease/putative transposase, partial [Armatimonadetes bacterium]|nr:Rpn family recombination-promoting nuclease/putative transposase [Armatimonadota bacterium]
MPTRPRRLALPRPSAGKIQRFPNNLGQWLLELRGFVPGALRLMDPNLLPDLDLTRLARVPRTLLPTDLRHRENDGLFTAPALADDSLTLLLYEFKSYSDPATFIQALQYLTPFWARQTPPFHPGNPQEVRLAAPGIYVLHTGQQPWEQPRSLEESFRGAPTLLAGELPSLGRVRMLDLHR